ncbi:hypothetical protein C0584_03770 [Candidatus Parcubacteria bacterium]|nr:MAG: hypothetical protein C0584_03770 [Candidatus Parcubacteria bacterium]
MKKFFKQKTLILFLAFLFYFSSFIFLLDLDLINALIMFSVASLTLEPFYKKIKQRIGGSYSLSFNNIHRVLVIIILFLLFNILNSRDLVLTNNKDQKEDLAISTNSVSIISSSSPENSLIEDITKENEQKPAEYRVVEVIDGDTIKVDLSSRIETIRLIGIDTPETVHPEKPVECFGLEASQKLKALLDNTYVTLEADASQDNRDKYSRLLRYVYRDDGLFINKWLVENGYAYEYTYLTPYNFQKDFRLAENLAKDMKLGLWADGVCDNTILNLSEQERTCLIKGNISYTSEEKIYHLPDCDDYNKTVVNEAKGEKWFCTEEEALLAGWRKAGNCP